MQSLFSIVLLIFGFNANLSAAEIPLGMASAIDWVKPEGANVEPIFAQARQRNKPVFLYWGAVWCHPAIKSKRTYFAALILPSAASSLSRYT
jgi:hypothetical protein